MDNGNEKFEKIVSRLQANVPQLTDADALTASIMQRIEKPSTSKAPVYLLWIRTLSGIAAVFLIGLFVFEQNTLITTNAANALNSGIREVRVDSVSCVGQLNKVNILEAYLCHQQQNSIENKLYKTVTHSTN